MDKAASFWNDENVPKLIMLKASRFCEYTENYWAVLFKWLNLWYVDYISLKVFLSNIQKDETK